MARVFDIHGTTALKPYEEKRARFKVIQGNARERDLFDSQLTVREVLDSFEGFSVAASLRERLMAAAAGGGAVLLFFFISFSGVI